MLGPIDYNEQKDPSEWIWKTGSSKTAPKLFEEAMSSPERGIWKNAYQDEYDRLFKRETFESSTLPSGRKGIKSRMAFSYDENGKPRAKLVAIGSSQTRGVDFEETSAPTLPYGALRLFVAVAASKKMPIHRVVVEDAFLEGKLDKEIYMELPEGVLTFGFGSECYRLNKPIYGLKQAPRLWNEAIDGFLRSIGFTQSQREPCFYFMRKNGKLTMLVIYVDDILVAGENKQTIEEVKTALKRRYTVDDKGLAKRYLNINITQRQGNITLDQDDYLVQVAKEFGLTDLPPSSNPTPRPTALEPRDYDSATDAKRFRSLLGKLAYVAKTTRYDLIHCTFALSKYSRDPKKRHLDALYNAFAFALYHNDFKLIYAPTRERLELELFVSVDFGKPGLRKRGYGYVYDLNGSTVLWNNGNEQYETDDFDIANKMAMLMGMKEGEWTVKVLREMGEHPQAVKVYQDDGSD